MKIFASGFLLLLLITGCKVSFSSEPHTDLPKLTVGTAAEQAEAADAARQYLAMIDNKEYEKTWERAGSVLKATTNKLAWTNAVMAASQVLGSSSNREIEGIGFTTRIDPNVPVGGYVLVQFTSKSGNVTTTEKVVMQKEQGTWRIIGYFATKRAVFGTSS